MGQAKQRGTFEQRKAEAIERDRKIMQARQMVRQRRGKSTLGALMAAALVASANIPPQRIENEWPSHENS
jgi:cytochrome b